VLQAFAQLFYVRYLPDAYHAALDEVVRRKAFGKQLAALFTQFAQRLARIRDDEIKQRDAYTPRIIFSFFVILIFINIDIDIITKSKS
jgi:hypothetical protein